jgi:hypothetical protein
MRKMIFLLFALLTACSVIPPEAPAPKATPPPCALLLSESNLQFAKSASFTRGPAVYSNLMASIQSALIHRGLRVDFVSEEDLSNDRLKDYRVLYIIDTFSITADSENAIRRFVEAGGVLVGVNEVGRYQGGWSRPWHYEDIFGVEALKIDVYDTALSESPDLFHEAVITSNGLAHPLTSNLGPMLDFGPHAGAIWATRATTATVLAEFPKYIKTPKAEGGTSAEIDEPVVAASIHDFGRGKAIWISVNMHGRQPEAWPATGDTLDLLARSADYAVPEIQLASRPVEVYLGLSQLGYAPGEKKTAIIRVPREKSQPFDQASYVIFREGDTNALLQGSLVFSGPDNRWNDYYYSVDLSSLREEGQYYFEARLSGQRGESVVKGGPFRIASNLWTSVILPTQYHFLKEYRCGQQCHQTDPIRGGYHDAAGDYAVRMWSMPHVIYGLAENIRASADDPERAAHLQELEWALDWMLKMQAPDGTVWLSVKPVGDVSPIELRPKDDPTQRVLEKGFNLNYQLTYIAGMAHAAQVLAQTHPALSQRVLQAATNAYDKISKTYWAQGSTADAGNFLWSCVELYNATKDDAYLQKARQTAPIILARQFLDGSKAEAHLRGDFFDQAAKTSFGDKQYKKFHAFGIYIGLIEMVGVLSPEDKLREQIIQALDIYFQEQLLRGAKLTPYGQMITALEPKEDGTFKVYVFTHLESWVHLHGLNVDYFAFGYAALRYAQTIDRPDLIPFALSQAQWVVGMNPFGYCMLDFTGWQQPPMIDDKLGTGRIKGGIPNGIVGDLKDAPAWGTTWDSREYWIPHNAYLLAIAPHWDRAAAQLK